jgi:hypothetical protein
MRFEDGWVVCSDGVVQPAIGIQLLVPSGQVAAVPFLLDTGADATGVAQQLAVYTGLSPRTLLTIQA